MEGLVFDIQRFSLFDGPGIRTAVFLKGCPLDCLWCHNPESKSGCPEILYASEKCVLCGQCQAACPQRCHRVDPAAHLLDRQACTQCGLCAKACPFGALSIIGRRTTVAQALEEALRDRAFYAASGGGVTLSGGEPLSQPAFSLAFLREAKALGLHTCVETSGFAPFDRLDALAGHTDLFLYDWKESDSVRHRRWTGAPNERIRENLLLLDRRGAQIVLRCPVVPGYNDTQAHFAGIAGLAGQLRGIRKIQIMAYHAMGGCKHERLGRANPLPSLPTTARETAAGYVERLRSLTPIPVEDGNQTGQAQWPR